VPQQQAFQAPAGTRDVLAPDSARWEALVVAFGREVERAGYGLVLSPMFEEVGVFVRGMGEGTDVVSKEMYEFRDKGDRHLALRPEGTASLVRAFVQLRPPVVWKAWYVTPAFRYERPQAGRYRQHHQLGVEALGTEDPDLDAEVVALAARFFGGLGLRRVELKLNSMGDGTCRPAYIESLRAYLAEHEDELCDEHRERYAANPLRVLDCKDEACVRVTANAPRLSDALCGPCEGHFARVRFGLDALGIRYTIDHRLVRGFDYYTRTAFEFAAHALEAAQNGIGGGGRYDDLVQALGGPPTPGIGFAIGIERLLQACDAEGVFRTPTPSLDAFVVDLTDGAAARDITDELRRAGLSADRAWERRSAKAQLRAADRSGAELALIVGPDEVAAGTVTLHWLRVEREEERVPRHEVAKAVRDALERARS
jgi:histidyl-tRNA synthetase